MGFLARLGHPGMAAAVGFGFAFMAIFTMAMFEAAIGSVEPGLIVWFVVGLAILCAKAGEARGRARALKEGRA